VVSFVCVLALLAQPSDPAASDAGIVRVQVLWGANPAPVETEVRMSVPSILCSVSQDLASSLRKTDQNGWVTFDGPAPARTRFTARHPSLGEASADLEGPGPIVVQFPVGQPIGGRVLDGKGRPVWGAAVAVVSRDLEGAALTPRRTRADKDGSFLFANLQPATWLLTASVEDVWSPGLEVHTGAENLVVPARAWFSGVVLDGKGVPVKDPWLWVGTLGADRPSPPSLEQPRTKAEYQALLKPTGEAADPTTYEKYFGGDPDGHFTGRVRQQQAGAGHPGEEARAETPGARDGQAEGAGS